MDLDAVGLGIMVHGDGEEARVTGRLRRRTGLGRRQSMLGSGRGTGEGTVVPGATTHAWTPRSHSGREPEVGRERPSSRLKP